MITTDILMYRERAGKTGKAVLKQVIMIECKNADKNNTSRHKPTKQVRVWSTYGAAATRRDRAFRATTSTPLCFSFSTTCTRPVHHTHDHLGSNMSSFLLRPSILDLLMSPSSKAIDIQLMCVH